MTKVVNIQEAETHLSRLIARVMAGEEVIIARAGKPAARRAPFEARAAERLPGLAACQIRLAPDFDAPLPREVL